MKHFLGIIGLSIVSAIVYGIIHDQITARICIEYFTIGHAPIFNTVDPTLLGLGWGVLATWWVGLLLGIPLALVARAGRWPKRSAGSLVRPVLHLMLVTACSAVIAGALGWLLARNGSVVPGWPMYELVPPEKHVAFMTAMWSHGASYFVGFVGGAIVIVRVGYSRSAVSAVES